MGRSGALRILAELAPIALLSGLVVGAALVVAQAKRRLRPQPVRAAAVAMPSAAETDKPAPLRPLVDSAAAPTVDMTLAEAGLYKAQAAAQRDDRDRLRARRMELERQDAAVQAEHGGILARAASLRTQSEELRSRIGQIEAEATAWQSRGEELRLRLDVEKRALEHAKRKAEDSYAVVPNRAANGTWRQPIVIDCREGVVKVLPDGPEVPLSEADALVSLRSHPLATYVRRRAMELEDQRTADGTPSVAYVLFLVRPEGIRPFYEARAILEPTGIAFGYELIGQDWDVGVPESTSTATQMPNAAPLVDNRMPRAEGSVARGDEGFYVWPGPTGGDAPGRGSAAVSAPPGVSGVAPSANSIAGQLAAPGADVEVSLDSPHHTIPDTRRGSAGVAARDPELEGYVEVIPRGVGGRRGADGSTPSGRAAPTGSGERPGTASSGGSGSRGAGNGLRGPTSGPASRGNDAVARESTTPAVAAEGSQQLNQGVADGNARGPTSDAPDRSNDVRAGEAGFASSGAAGPRVSGPPPRVQWLDVTVICRPREVVVEPGGYRITASALTSTKLLVERLTAIAHAAESGSPDVIRRPRLKFLVEPGGEESFVEARRQTTYTDLDWPTTLQMTEGTRLRNPMGLSGFDS